MTWIEHPEISGSVVEVPDSSVPYHQAAGWQVVDPPVHPKKHTAAAKQSTTAEGVVAEPGAEAASGTESPKRRRPTKEQDA